MLMPNSRRSGCPRNIELTSTVATVSAVTHAKCLRSSAVLLAVKVMNIGIAAAGSAITNRAVAICALVFQSCIWINATVEAIYGTITTLPMFFPS
jgi:hypothetical protein